MKGLLLTPTPLKHGVATHGHVFGVRYTNLSKSDTTRHETRASQQHKTGTSAAQVTSEQSWVYAMRLLPLHFMKLIRNVRMRNLQTPKAEGCCRGGLARPSLHVSKAWLHIIFSFLVVVLIAVNVSSSVHSSKCFWLSLHVSKTWLHIVLVPFFLLSAVVFIVVNVFVLVVTVTRVCITTEVTGSSTPTSSSSSSSPGA